jgi:hypothetical protein
MGRLRVTPYFTHAPAEAAQIQRTFAGMAHFANTGPFATYCRDCEFCGAWQQKLNAAGVTIGTARVKGACQKFKKLTGTIGPVVPADTLSCKYFSRGEANGEGGRNT